MTENTKETETHAPESGGGTGAPEGEAAGRVAPEPGVDGAAADAEANAGTGGAKDTRAADRDAGAPDGGAGGPPMDDGEDGATASGAPEAGARAGAGADAEAGGEEDWEGGAEDGVVRDVPPDQGTGAPVAPANAGGSAKKPRGGELRRLNENIEQLIDEMTGLEVEGGKAGALLSLLTGLRAWKPDTSDAGIPRTAVPVGAADMHRWIEADRRRRRHWYGLAAAAAAPAALLLGLLVQLQFQVIPLHDPSGGWSGWIWETHGRAIVDCAVEARRTNAEVNCGLAVRRP